jgi:hypothetical protein
MYLKTNSVDRSPEARPETGKSPMNLAARNTDRNSRLDPDGSKALGPIL